MDALALTHIPLTLNEQPNPPWWVLPFDWHMLPRWIEQVKPRNDFKCETNLESGGENINCNQFQEYNHYSTGIWGPLEIILGGSRKLKNCCRFETQISHPTLSSPQDPLLLVARFLPPSDFPLCTLAEIIKQTGSPTFILTPINYINHMLLFY